MKYDELFEKHPIRFRTPEEAEATLTRLTKLWGRFRRSRNSAGLARVAHEAEKGRRRAAMIAKNRRVRLEKRREKEEIALWFEIWLLEPEAFSLWLQMRREKLDSASE